MKKLVCSLSVFVILLSSCTQDSPVSGTTTNPDDILVKEMSVNTIAGESGGGMYDFTYNGKKISKIHERFVQWTIDVVYTYTGDLITSEEWFNVKQNGSLMKKYVYEYDGNGRLENVRFQYGAPGSSLILYKKYTYNADGTVLENNNPSDQLTYYFNNGEIVKTVQATQSSTTTLNYMYDNENSPFKNIIGFNKLIIFYQNESSVSNDFRVGSQHNIKSIVSSTGDAIYKVNYTYDLLFRFPLRSVFDNGFLERQMQYY